MAVLQIVKPELDYGPVTDPHDAQARGNLRLTPEERLRALKTVTRRINEVIATKEKLGRPKDTAALPPLRHPRGSPSTQKLNCWSKQNGRPRPPVHTVNSVLISAGADRQDGRVENSSRGVGDGSSPTVERFAGFWEAGFTYHRSRGDDGGRAGKRVVANAAADCLRSGRTRSRPSGVVTGSARNGEVNFHHGHFG